MKRLAIICAVLAMAPAVQAGIVGADLGTVAPSASLGGFTMTAFPDDTRDVLTDVTSVASPLGGQVDFSSTVSLREIGDGWSTWSHGYTGDVYFTTGATLTLTLPSATAAFYLYAEPNPMSPYEITATALGGAALTQTVDGNGGANGYGFYGTAGDILTSITIDYAGPSGFAVGEFGIAAVPVPVPGAGLLGLLGLSVAGAKLRKRREA